MEMDGQSPPSYDYVEPPSYASQVSSSRGVPPIQSEQEYCYKGDHLVLSLGPRRQGVFRPTYGWNDDISGYVLIRSKVKKVKCIKILVEGYLTAGTSEGGFLIDHKRVAILKASQTLLETPEGEEDVCCPGGARYPFTFPLPSYITGGMETLPPTSSVIHMGMTASVTYTVRVEMIRNGKLRANERLGTFFNYLPRTFAPPSGQFGRPSSIDEKFEELGSVALSEWQSFNVLPKIPPTCGNAVVPLSPCILQVSLHLRKPLIYASNSPLPFRIEIISPDIDPLLSLYSDLKVDLVRATTIALGDRWTVREILVGKGETKRIEETPLQKIMYGEVTCSDQGESSWRAEHIDVRHLLRIKLSPRANSPSLSKSLPAFSHYVYVDMRTHLRDEVEIHEARLPAFARLPRQFLGTTT